MADDTLFEIPGGRARAHAVTAVFDPSRLTQSRQARAWTKKHLAEELGVSPAAIGQYESGVIKPRAEQLERLADLLDVPVGFFAVGRPKSSIDVSQTHFRSLRSMPAYERDQALTYMEQVWELCLALERRVVLPNVDLPEPADGTEAGGLIGAASAARLLRSQWRLGGGPVAHLVRLMEAHGIVVGLLPFSDSGRVDAFSSGHGVRPIVVLASDRDDVYRHRFTAAHELGHLVLHRDARPGDVRNEREANAFAAELLMPEERMRRVLPRRVDFPRLVALQKQWGVSVKALLYRSRELGIISDDSHRRASMKLNALVAQEVVKSESVSDYPGELPQLLARAAVAGGDRIDDLASELEWTSGHVRRLLNQPEPKPRLRLVED